MTLARFDPIAVGRVRLAMVGLVVVGALFAATMVLMKGGSSVQPTTLYIYKALGVAAGLMVCGYSVVALKSMQPDDPAVWIRGCSLSARSPHLMTLALDHSVKVETVTARSIYGRHLSLIVTNGHGAKLPISGFYFVRPVADLAAEIMAHAARC